MPVENAADSSSFWGAAAVILATAIVGVYRQFFGGKKDEAKPSHYVLEAAEIADVSALRELARQFGPALEKLVALDTYKRETNARFEHQLHEILTKLETMERAAQVAKEVREELARRTADLERRGHRDRGHDAD